MEANLTPVGNLTYEEAFAELERISQALEQNPASLDENLALMERGLALVQRCTALLDQAELKVRKLSGEEIAGLQDEGQD